MEILHHLAKGHGHTGAGNDSMGEIPVVVKAAAVFVILNPPGGDFDAGEVRRCARDGLPVGFGDVREHPVHIENKSGLAHFFQTSLRAASSRRVCARVPTVMRTHPGAS